MAKKSLHLPLIQTESGPSHERRSSEQLPSPTQLNLDENVSLLRLEDAGAAAMAHRARSGSLNPTIFTESKSWKWYESGLILKDFVYNFRDAFS